MNEKDLDGELSWNWRTGPIGRLVKVAHISLRRELEEQLKSVGLSHAQWNAITIISHFPGISPSEMEPILMIERASITSLINGLVKKGLVVRKDHPEDARYKKIYLTDEGEKLAAETKHFTTEMENRVRAGMSQQEFDTLRNLLTKMVDLFQEPK
jgi:MarR family transcriptional regulator for hemolysin